MPPTGHDLALLRLLPATATSLQRVLQPPPTTIEDLCRRSEYGLRQVGLRWTQLFEINVQLHEYSVGSAGTFQLRGRPPFAESLDALVYRPPAGTPISVALYAALRNIGVGRIDRLTQYDPIALGDWFRVAGISDPAQAVASLTAAAGVENFPRPDPAVYTAKQLMDLSAGVPGRMAIIHSTLQGLIDVRAVVPWGKLTQLERGRLNQALGRRPRDVGGLNLIYAFLGWPPYQRLN